MGEGGGGGKEDAGGELAGEDLSQRLCKEGEVLDEVKGRNRRRMITLIR